ncbi:hypothetical protein BpHYR1_001424 [Brachionus plicatilis]|uniref:Uncharacterized protein n=1 Tax=Brachionus plicatilis TaxID=10195 RepID=A0A3M7PM34_BRAPC|nr:hypothetical protein BpHYR1_001424 [Brachionus plicatilis]
MDRKFRSENPGFKTITENNIMEIREESIENADWLEYEKTFDKLNTVQNTFDFNKFPFANIDKDLAPFGHYSDEDIINTINREQDDEQLDKDEHVEPKENALKISEKETTDCIDKLRLYFAQKNEDCSLFIDLLSIMDQFCSVDQSFQKILQKLEKATSSRNTIVLFLNFDSVYTDPISSSQLTKQITSPELKFGFLWYLFKTYYVEPIKTWEIILISNRNVEFNPIILKC